MQTGMRNLAVGAWALLLLGLLGGLNLSWAQQGGGGSPLAPEILVIDLPQQIP